jgi:hypothetical protein
MLVETTQDDAVLDLPAARVLHFRIVDFLYFDLASAEIHHTTIARHAFTSLLFLWNRVAQAGSALSARVQMLFLCCLLGPHRWQASSHI